MSDYAISVSPLARVNIERVAQAILQSFEPKHLEIPRPLNLERWVEVHLPRNGVEVCPIDKTEAHGCEAYVPFERGESADACCDILLIEDQWEAVMGYGHPELRTRARSTLAHELGHVVLHVPQLRRLIVSASLDEQVLARRNGDIPVYMNSEWQAWEFAGSLLMPKCTLEQIAHMDDEYIAHIYEVSVKFAQTRLGKLKLRQSK